GDMLAAFPLLNECRELADRFGDQSLIARATSMRGLSELHLGRADDALAHLKEAVRLERQLPGFDPHLATALFNVGTALCYEEQLGRAADGLEDANRLSTVHGEQWQLS